MTLLFPKKRKAGLKELSGAKMYLKHLQTHMQENLQFLEYILVK